MINEDLSLSHSFNGFFWLLLLNTHCIFSRKIFFELANSVDSNEMSLSCLPKYVRHTFYGGGSVVNS